MGASRHSFNRKTPRVSDERSGPIYNRCRLTRQSAAMFNLNKGWCYSA
jgi:hypothetical protein